MKLFKKDDTFYAANWIKTCGNFVLLHYTIINTLLNIDPLKKNIKELKKIINCRCKNLIIKYVNPELIICINKM